MLVQQQTQYATPTYKYIYIYQNTKALLNVYASIIETHMGLFQFKLEVFIIMIPSFFKVFRKPRTHLNEPIYVFINDIYIYDSNYLPLAIKIQFTMPSQVSHAFN